MEWWGPSNGLWAPLDWLAWLAGLAWRSVEKACFREISDILAYFRELSALMAYFLKISLERAYGTLMIRILHEFLYKGKELGDGLFWRDKLGEGVWNKRNKRNKRNKENISPL